MKVRCPWNNPSTGGQGTFGRSVAVEKEAGSVRIPIVTGRGAVYGGIYLTVAQYTSPQRVNTCLVKLDLRTSATVV